MRRIDKKQKLFRLRIFLITAALVSVIVVADRRIRPIVYDMSEHASRETAVMAVNKTVEELLTDENNNFSKLAEIKYNNSGDISSVQTDVTGINLLQSKISQLVTKDFDNISENSAEFSLGTLSGFSPLNNLGPKIRIKILPIGNVETSLISTFKNAGINQSNHQIILNVKARVITVLPGYSQKNDINLQYILSDTVIVGNVPDGYTYISGDGRDIISKANDYSGTQIKK